MAVSAGSRIAALLWAAAVLIAAFPASAQTNDPNLTEQDLDCLRRQAAGGPECVPGQTPEDGAAQPDEFVIQGQPSTREPDAADTDDPATAPTQTPPIPAATPPPAPIPRMPTPTRSCCPT